jgi:hypothetical protein
MTDTRVTAVESAAREKYCVLIPHPTELRVLLVRHGERRVLPSFLPDRDIHNLDLPHAVQTLRAQLGLEVTIRYALRVFEAAIPGALNIFVAEHGCADLPSMTAGDWIGRDALDDLDMASEGERDRARSRRVIAAINSTAVMRDRTTTFPVDGSKRLRIQSVPVSVTYRFARALVSVKQILISAVPR